MGNTFISPSEALPIALEVIHMLWGEVQPKCFSGMHWLLELHFGVEDAVTMPQVQDLRCISYRRFDHINDAGQPWGLTCTGEAQMLRP